MSEYISKESIVTLLEQYGYIDKEMERDLASIPSADVRENKHAYWKKRTYIGNHKTVTMNVCSECDKEFGWDIETGISMDDNNFCPNCGAIMDREPKGEKMRCNTCKNNDDELSGECYECIKGIFDHYEPKGEKGTE